jgi:ATP-dependent DNA helicase RecG
VAIDINSKIVGNDELARILSLEESHFLDLKGRDVTPAKLSRAISAFANTSGGELFVGIEEFEGIDGKTREWRGFKDQEAANPIFQVIQTMDPLNANISTEFLKCEGQNGLVLHIIIFKTASVVFSTESKLMSGGAHKIFRLLLMDLTV